MKPLFRCLIIGLAFLMLMVNGCGNSDDSVSLDKSQKAELVKLLGSYSGAAHAERIMGALMTGVWKVAFLQDDSGALMCKCTLRLHDEQNGWGSPTTVTTDVKVFKGGGAGIYDLRVEAGFSDTEPHWTIAVNGISPTSGQPINTFSLFDMSAYEIKLNRE